MNETETPFESRFAIDRRALLGSIAALMLPAPFLPAAAAEAPEAAAPPVLAPRQLPARLLPVPNTVSPELQAVIGAPYAPGWDTVPIDAAGWRTMQKASGEGADAALADIQQRLGVTVTDSMIGGVHCYVSTPDSMPPENEKRLLLHLHGGGYVLYPGAVGAGEGMMMAGYGRFRVVSVDYRMSPDFPFPAALEDAIAVWTALLADNDPKRMAIFGTSAGGGLTLATVLRAKADGLPLPAAIGPGSPWSDLSSDGDSVQANEYVDNVLVSDKGWSGAAATVYAGAHDIRDPLISPVYGDFSGFPPAILTSGTRDLLLSDTVRAHRRLRQAGVEAQLQVFEGQSHAQFLTPFVPETEEAFGEIAKFFSAHLAA